MAEPITVDNGGLTDYDVLVDDVTDATLGTGAKQLVGLTDATIGSTTKVAAGGGVEANALRVTIASDSTGVVSVDDNGSSLTVDGSVTANAGTNLNTSALALESGGNLAAIAASASVLDDWDESDRAKVNLIAGQAAITAGAGNVAANTPRVTLAADDPAVASLAALDNAISGNELQVDIVSAPTLTVNSHAVTNAGTFAVQVDGAALTALQLLDDTILADDIGFTPGTTKVSMAGFQADEASTDSVDEGDAGAARMTLDRKVIVSPQPHTTGGLSIFRSLDLDETEEDVKTSAGQVYGWYIANLATTTRFVKFYNATAANVNVGSTTPVLTLPIPGNSTDDVAANALGGMGITFDTAISVAATTGVADADTGAPSANDVVINVFYK